MEHEMERLVEQLNRYAHAYYVLDRPMVSDGQYDALYDQLLALEQQTGVVLPHSPTARVGGEPLTAFTPHTHLGRLWSLDKGKTREQILSWEARVEKLLSAENLQADAYLLEYKIDGLTINLTYDNGLLVEAATRGNGVVGESILPQVKTIRSVPLRVPYTGRFEVQGEGYMPLSALTAYNQSATETLKNARNAAAGALRNLDPKQTQKRQLAAFFYQVGYIEGRMFESALQMRVFLEENGFLLTALHGVFQTAGEAFDAAMALDQTRQQEDFLTDGMVIKVNDMHAREVLGYTDKFPRWAVAVKFEAQEAITTLLDVRWEVGRTGKLTPSAVLDTVELGGASVSRATLNNIGDIRRKHVKLGGKVWVRRSNDVIPEILGNADEEGSEIEAPTHCPYCGTAVIEQGAHLFCPNEVDCKPQRLAALCHFVSRDAMDIVGLSEKTLERAMEELSLTTPDGLYAITEEQWLTLEGFAQTRARNVYEAVQASKACTLERFLFALGIKNVGKKAAQTLSDRLGSLQAVMAADEAQLEGMEDIGPIVAGSIVQFFAGEEQRRVIENLLAAGVAPQAAQPQQTTGPFTGQTIVFTGTLSTMGRKEAQALAKNLGATVGESVTAKTTLLVAGENAGSKLDKAKKLGIEVREETEFFAALEEKGEGA